MALFKKKNKPKPGKGRPGKTLIWAILFGVIAAVLAGLYIKQRADQYLAELKRREAPEISVVVASQNLQLGSIVSEDVMSVRAIPADLVPTGTIRPNEFAAYKGRVITQPIAQGTPLLRAFVADGVVLDFSDTLKHTKRAMTIEVDELKSIGGLARPGNRIDILVLLPPGTRSPEDSSDVVLQVLQNVLVLATGEETTGRYQEKVLRGQGQIDTRYTNVTVEVDPREGALLSQAADKGELITLLRNREDISGSDFAQVTPQDLYDNAERIAEAARQKAQARSLDNLIVRDGKIYTADGIEVKDPNLIVKDGVIMTKDGVVLNGKGLFIDDEGNIRTADGRRISADNIVVSEDGKVMTKDGIVLGDDVQVTEDGLLLAADGTLMTKDGRVLGRNLKRTKDGFLVDENGRVMTKDGTVLAGVTLNENGEVVTADGRVLKADEIVVNADGSVSDLSGELIAGVTGRAVEEDDRRPGDIPSFIEFLAGGVSQNGVATVAELPVLGEYMPTAAVAPAAQSQQQLQQLQQIQQEQQQQIWQQQLQQQQTNPYTQPSSGEGN